MFVDVTKLKSPLGVLETFSPDPIPFSTEPVFFNAADYDSYVLSWKIVNRDSVNFLQYQLDRADSIQLEVDPNSDVYREREWCDYLRVIPDGTTGKGWIELTLVKSKEALK